MTEQAPAGKTVLIVDDDPFFQEGAAFLLQQAGFEVVQAKNGKEALHLLHGGLKPSVILLDMLMPIVDGWKFLEERRQVPALWSVPVVVLTGLGVASSDWADSLGCSGFLRKPVDVQALLDEVKRIVNQET
jgi:CheY-like chemotaxis protein